MIRLANKNDTNALLALLGEVLSIHAECRPDIFKVGTTKYSESDIHDLIKNPLSPIYVYEDNGVVVGYAFCEIKEQIETSVLKPYKYLYIDDLCVKSSCRGLGIGRALYNYVKGEAERFNCTRITLNVWNNNENALAFYKALGLNALKTTMEENL